MQFQVEMHIADAVSKGGELTTGGKRPDSKSLVSGNFIEPAVIRNANHHM